MNSSEKERKHEAAGKTAPKKAKRSRSEFESDDGSDDCNSNDGEPSAASNKKEGEARKNKVPGPEIPAPSYEYERYLCSKDATGDEIRQKIAQFGVAIVPDVLNEDECRHVTECAWSFFEKITEKCEKPINRNDQSTWCLFKQLLGKLGGQLYQTFGTGVMEGSRFCRVKGASVFAKLYKVRPEDLLVSVDAFSFGIPPKLLPKREIVSREHATLHCDQSFAKSGLVTIQSWITSEDVVEGDRTLEFLEGSHVGHDEFAKKFFRSCKVDPPKDDWFQMKDHAHIAFYEADGRFPRRRIRCPKGSMVLWDSRTVHSGSNPVKGYEHNLRCVSYVCCLPRKKATPKELARKKKFANELLEKAATASHNPISFTKFSSKPRTYGNPFPPLVEFPPPSINSFTPLEKALYGF